MPAHIEGHEGNLPIGTHIWNLRMSGPLDGALGVPTTVHPLCPFVPHSGCFERLWPNSAGFAFEPWALESHDNHGTHFGYSFHISRCIGRIVWGVGWRVRLFLLCFFTEAVELSRFASSVVTLRGYKTGARSYATYIFLHNLPPSLHRLPHDWKQRGNRETDLKNKRELLSLWGVVPLSLPFHGRIRLAHVRGHVRAPAKFEKLGRPLGGIK
jgi:hypothetical protein